MKTNKQLLLTAGVALLCTHAPAQILIGSLTYNQNFDSLLSTPLVNPWTDNSTLLGWYAATVATGSATDYVADNGYLPVALLHSYGADGATDRALGSIADATTGSLTFGLRLRNDSAMAYNTFTISFTGEQWHNADSMAQMLSTSYRVSASPITSPDPANTEVWTPLAALTFTSPQVLPVTSPPSLPAALDGNAAANRIAFAPMTLSGVTLNSGEELFIRWRDMNDAGLNHGLAIDDFSLSAEAVPAQPVIVTQPQNQTNLLGSTATFQVTATGTPPLSYQWRSYTSGTSFTNITGAMTDSLALTNVQPTQQRFGVIVSNAEGAVTSILATLTVLLPPGITAQPQSAVVSIGQSAGFDVTASGTVPFRYQWQRNGEALPAATNRSLSFVAAQPTNDAAYNIVVSNPYGAVTSRVATLSVLLPVAALQARAFTNAPPGPLPYRLFVPTNYNAAERYPLVMFLHGAGERGNDNTRQLSVWPDCLVYVSYSRQLSRPAFFVAPQCPVTRDWGEPVMVTQLLALFDALAEEFSIDTNRISVTGLSMGGYGAWSLLQQRPAFFAAAVPICGGGNPGLAMSIRHVPAWNFHAANDGTVPVNESRSMISALRQAGGSPIYTEYANGGHVIWPGAYRNPYVIEWTFAQQRAQPPTTDPRVSFLNPREQDSFTTGAGTLDLSGTASAYGEPITQVRWTNTLARATGLANGTNPWSIDRIPLQRPGTNLIVVTATTTSWSAEFGGATTFNRALAVQQATPIYATISRGETNLVLNWTGGAPPFRVERLNAVASGGWMELLNNAVAPMTLPSEAESAFYRIAGQ